ncbi:BTB/POZ domain-containing protein [Phthorimaea operculella]|nr:BTB/POZ domain-containing protein [Phthorimaea operculella]
MEEAGSSNPDWQLSCTKSKERLGYLLKTKLWADCKFLVGEDETEEIAAHKFVLAMCSPVFDTMFNGSMPEDRGAIRVPDVQPKAFKKLLLFLYTDETKLTSYQEASEVYCAARKYMLPFIQQHCVGYLEWKLTPTNACFAHEFATLFEETSLLKAALKTFKRKTKEVLKEGSFYETHINTVTSLFSQNELDIDTEMDLFIALEKYASETMGLRNLKRNFSTVSQEGSQASPSKRPRLEDKSEMVPGDDMEKRADDQTEDEKRLLAEVRQAVSHIRFLTLPARQFAAAASSALLTVDEAYAVMMNLSGVPVALPGTVHSGRVPRGVREVSINTIQCQAPRYSR